MSLMELDLDSFLRSHGANGSDDDDDDDPDGFRRTVDEILNDSDSSSSPSSGGGFSPRASSSPLALADGAATGYLDPSGAGGKVGEPLRRAISGTLEDFPAISTPGRAARELSSSSVSSSLGMRSSSSSFSSPRLLPPLFGGVRPNPKPGAALAAAAAASRSIPTPHAAAILSRRASASSLDRITQPQDAAEDDLFEENVNFGGQEGEAPSGDSHLGGEMSVESDTGKRVSNSNSNTTPPSSPSSSSSSSRISNADDEEIPARDENAAGSSPPDDQSWTAKEIADEELEASGDLAEPSSANLTSVIENEYGCQEVVSSPVLQAAAEEPHYLESSHVHEYVTDKIDQSSRGEDIRYVGKELKALGNASEALEENLSQLESNKRSITKAEKRLRSCMKPLEWAEELEKRQASSGLHWEEGAVAQPMRLEGIRREPPAVGYLQIDPQNGITRAFSSQSFLRDQGSPQVLAVHMNSIAIGTSKGLVLIFPSRYSPHWVDNMDAKMLVLGSQGDKSQSPVTSLCFNQQGDLLLVGYGDGHITAWDVQKATAMKVITGEHAAPVVHTLFLGQDSLVTRQFKVVTGDSKGLVLLHAFSTVPLLNRFSIKTQCLLDGQKTGTVLSVSPLLIDDLCTGLSSAQGIAAASTSGLSSMVGGVVGGVVGGEAGWKLFNEGTFMEEGVVVFATHQNALVVRLTPNLEVYAQFSRPDGVREGSMPYTAWKCTICPQQTNAPDRVSWLAIAWDRKVEVFKLIKSDLTKHGVWDLDGEAIGIEWLDDQMLVILTLRGYLCLYTKDGNELHRTSFVVDATGRDDIIAYHTYFTNNFGNPEKAYHNSVGVRGATVYILGPMHLTISRLLPWKERIQTLQKAGDWMGALDLAMRLYDGQAHGVIDLPKSIDAVREATMPFLVEMILSYVDEVFSYISVAHGHQIGKVSQGEDPYISSSERAEIDEQFARVGGVSVEFCIHIKRTDILFDDIFSKFTAVKHEGTFLEILEPYILKDMLGSLPPEVMQALVDHYSNKGWLHRVEQCVLHMDISSLDFNQVIRLCREHGLYSALIYLFNRGLDDYRTPLEELLVVVQNNQRVDASIGYRMLVYLKYCFLGLAFPPGHGTLPPSRLPSVRKELLQFLLEDSSALASPVIKSMKSSCGVCPNLCYLLWLDTESTLEVMRCAFSNDTFTKLNNSSEYSTETHMEEKIDTVQNPEDQNVLVQIILSSLIVILDMESNVIRYFQVEENGIVENWPSKRDVGHVIEFIAYFITCKQATASGKVLKHILEYLTSDVSPSVGPSQRNEASQREKQVLSLLKVVPQMDWDLSCVLNQCLEAHFHQACGLIHMIRGQHIAALDSYMKDFNEPFYAFAFVFDMLLKLNDSESSTFRSAVMSRIPELAKLSREDTFLLVIDQFSKESQQIMSELQSHPRSLFLFLKTIIDVHLHGTLNFPILGDSQNSDVLLRRMKDGYTELGTYLDRISSFTKLLQQNPFNVDDKTAELYLELLCQYERGSVLRFLETFDNYRLEHCLRLCQEYGVNDAAAFLLERVGDVGSALELLMTGLDEKFVLLATAVEQALPKTSSRTLCSMELLDTSLKMDEVSSVHGILHSAIGLCQRNTQRLDPLESELLWFRLLDLYCEPLRELYDDKEISPDVKRSMLKQRFREIIRGAGILRCIFSHFIKEIVEGMVGHVPLPAIMGKLLADNGGQEFGDFKFTLLGLLGTYGYERRILGTAKSLIEDDTFYTLSLLRKGASHAYAPQSLVCCLCGSSLAKVSSSSSIRVFNCGHATHLHCEPQENGVLGRDSSAGCPVCMPKRKPLPPRGKSILMENRLIRNSLSQTTKGVSSVYHLHEPDAIERPHGNPQMSRFEMLNNLQETRKLLQVDPLPQLRLAPPSIYHEKVQKGTDVLQRENSNPQRTEKPNKSRQIWDSKSKGFSKRFPLKTNIFGKEKSASR